MYEVSEPLPKETQIYLNKIFIYSHTIRRKEQRLLFERCVLWYDSWARI